MSGESVKLGHLIRKIFKGIKYACHEIHLLLYEILCTVLTTGIVPKQWHINQIAPIYKQRGGPKESLSQNRPICLMEIIKKIEGALLPTSRRLLPYPEDQYGYIKRTSTLDAAYALQSRLTEIQLAGESDLYEMDKMDIAAAFDSVDHSKLEIFIRQYVICPVLQYLFLSLLLVQNLGLIIGNKRSGFLQVKRGILQGSNLSPFLFISSMHWALSPRASS